MKSVFTLLQKGDEFKNKKPTIVRWARIPNWLERLFRKRPTVELYANDDSKSFPCYWFGIAPFSNEKEIPALGKFLSKTFQDDILKVVEEKTQGWLDDFINEK